MVLGSLDLTQQTGGSMVDLAYRWIRKALRKEGGVSPAVLRGFPVAS